MRLPLLDLWIELPYFRARTSILCRRYERKEIEYIGLDIQVWKWRFKVGLYERRRS